MRHRVAGLRTGDNPARYRGHLEYILPKTKRLTKHFAALDYREMPEFLAVCKHDAVIVGVLTCARASEVLKMRWDEIKDNVWTVPGAHESGSRTSRAFSQPVLEILKRQPKRGLYVFGGGRMWSSTLNRAMPPGTTFHGNRSSFRDWAAEQTNSSRDVIEQALAHVLGNAVELAYRRSDLFEKRRELLNAWAEFCTAGSNVIALKRSA